VADLEAMFEAKVSPSAGRPRVLPTPREAALAAAPDEPVPAVAVTRPPTAFFLAMSPEASTYAFVQFGSSRTPGAIPTLHLTYALPYRFEAQ
jgi:hypothetical protein